MNSTIPQHQIVGQDSGQDSDPDMDEALRRVRNEPLPRPRPSGSTSGEASVLLALELDFLLTPDLYDIDGESDGCPMCGHWTCMCPKDLGQYEVEVAA